VPANGNPNPEGEFAVLPEVIPVDLSLKNVETWVPVSTSLPSSLQPIVEVYRVPASDKEGAMHWLNEPAKWSEEFDVLRVTADAGTDFWRTTGYGYNRDTGHLYGDVTAGELDLSMRLCGSYSAQYDQAGAMVRIDERNWIKTGIEYFEGRMRLSTVVTYEYSSWVVAELPESTNELALLLTRRGDALEVRYSLDGGAQELAALVHLPPEVQVLAGAMCAAPTGGGFQVTFQDLSLVVL
jgi:regulation of enolase protein 1 (concanavalin A-like superfamily)